MPLETQRDVIRSGRSVAVQISGIECVEEVIDDLTDRSSPSRSHRKERSTPESAEVIVR